MSGTRRLVRVDLDETSLAHPNPDVEHERRVAIYDLIEENEFALAHGDGAGHPGPFVLKLSIQENRLIMDVRDEAEAPLQAFHLSLSPFRRVVKDYFMLCESYHSAIREATPSQIEAIDMGRRGLHNEGSELLAERLKGKVETDFDTARRLFTLLCALHWKG